MAWGKTFVTTLAFVSFLYSVKCLEPPETYGEGSCTQVRWWGTGGIFNETLYDWMSTLKYVIAGDKYNFYKLASILPSYKEMSELDLVDKLCLTRDAVYLKGIGQATYSGFRRILSDFDFVSGDVPGGNKYWDHTPARNSPIKEKFRQTITHTDHESFVFLVACWEGSNQRTWEVVSNTPELTEEKRKDIIVHARGMGFTLRNFVFPNYGSACAKSNPLLVSGGSSKTSNSSLRKSLRGTWITPAPAYTTKQFGGSRLTVQKRRPSPRSNSSPLTTPATTPWSVPIPRPTSRSHIVGDWSQRQGRRGSGGDVVSFVI